MSGRLPPPGPNAVVSAVKRADGEAGVGVRLYEAGGSHRTVRLTFGLPGASRIRRVDLMERPVDGEVRSDGEAVVLDLHPFEIVTLLFSD